MIRASMVTALLVAGSVAHAQAPSSAPAKKAAAAKKEDERTAVIGVLDKRLGTTEEFTLKPGGTFHFGRIDGVMKTCERTAPWEQPKQSGAFMVLVETPVARTKQEQVKPRTIFSGWLFAESPSLNPLQHPVYDVWLKSCAMNFPDKAPEKDMGSRTASAGSPSSTRGATETTGGTPK